MSHYNPDTTPNPAEWLQLDEQERVEQIKTYHRKAKVKIPGLETHVLMHMIVENQLAESVAVTVNAMQRLRAVGLSRHDSVHALSWVVLNHTTQLLNKTIAPEDATARFEAAMNQLSAQQWLKSVSSGR